MTHNMIHHLSAPTIPDITPQRSQTSASSSTPAGTGAQYDFASIFGAASDERGIETSPAAETPAAAAPASGRVQTPEAVAPAIAIATAAVTRPEIASLADTTTPAATTTTAATTAPAAAPAAAASTTTSSVTSLSPTTGIEALVSAITSGSVQVSYVTDPAKLQETNPVGTDYMPSFYYASDQTANQIAQLLGGTVVQMKAFGQDKGWVEPDANFIQLPNGMTFNAADVAYYAQHGPQGASQLMADITQTINVGSAWTNYYQNKGPMPGVTPVGYVGPPIPGMTYPSSMIGGDGNIINPGMQSSAT